MAAKHKNTIYKSLDIKNPFQEGQDKAYADILLDKVKECQLWRKSTFIHSGLFILSLIFFLISISQQQTVPVLVNVMPSGETQYLGEVRNSNFQVPDSAVHYQVRKFITNLRTISTDHMVVYNNIDECFHMVASNYSTILRRILTENSPFELVGRVRRTVDIESVLLVTGRSYQINWTETVIDSSTGQRTSRFRAVVTIILSTPTSQTIIRNPLGIYIENMEMTEL